MRHSGTLWMILVLALAWGGVTSVLQAQSLEDILGVNDSQSDSAGNVVVKRSVQTAGAGSPNAAAASKEIDRILAEINKKYENLRKILLEAAKKAKDKAKPSKKKKPSAPRTYRVVPGDTLFGIAQRFFGDGNRYWEIVEANKGRYPSLAKNPNLIYPGWTFTIPGTQGSSTPPTNSGPSTGKTSDSPALNAWKGGKLAPAEFARLLGPAARESMKRTGIPASVTLAQAALETGWGRATIGDAKNLFGIKGTGPAGSITVKTREYVNGRYITINAAFRKYHSWAESIDDHSRLVSQGARYRNCMKYKNNPDQFARELQKAGYATSPTYANTLISIMKSNNLYQWDK